MEKLSLFKSTLVCVFVSSSTAAVQLHVGTWQHVIASESALRVKHTQLPLLLLHHLSTYTRSLWQR